ncbi:hypothetical protein THAOC_36162 [Thalassiosira oceanica]|uniref:Cyclin-dependent kinase 2 homolog n=1 Tax=Thalassiosira oceanica TaxID=159749 RepID=K0RFC8_THAOC|nr:hypothetical protein THAOC_36162 [Thalassiosira oceanica]|mmetsp:Transcript_32820/g.78403  ORF Transcript_32820/g.78403 Transcript_32820/m.78403 type:complete len:387 (+) Transcript_32820:197-1357(+)|eukprot:EJK45227.1 hypothetical protein THAOC_36162 [Thalassiosira oceanica]
MPKRDRWSSDEDEEAPTQNNGDAEQPGGNTAELASSSLQIAGKPCQGSSSASPRLGYQLYNPLMRGCRSVYDSYERLTQIDEGTYGVVFKARDLCTDEIVAIKQIKFEDEITKEGFPISALREISVLLSLSHECIVTVREMVVGATHDKVFMVMEQFEMDLQAAMKSGPTASTPFSQSEVKHMLYQIVSAMDHVHSHWYMHRDMKTSNILVHRSGRLALCDFGMARKYQKPARKMTQMVCTLWYRAIELLFGEDAYGPSVDMWSIGCIFAELLTKDAILQGNGELDQVQKVFELLGTPDDDDWPEFKSLPSAGTFKWRHKAGSDFGKRFQVNSFNASGQSYLDPAGKDLLLQLFRMNPAKRISACDAIEHKYFTEGVAKRQPDFFL